MFGWAFKRAVQCYRRGFCVLLRHVRKDVIAANSFGGSGHHTVALGIETLENEAMADGCDCYGFDSFTPHSKFQVRFTRLF